tara:strand:- start:794 stop:976 length:183 start_codon:yes stop_codon:yes gene_type:complete
MDKLIQKTADNCIKEINEHIDNTIAWNLNSTTDLDGDEYYQLELKIKQQILFTLIKKVTK